MPDNAEAPKKSITPDWIVQGTLTRIGDMLDRLTGRSWQPVGSLATSGLIERMKLLIDSEIKVDSDGRSFVPHNIKLKMQWDKFSSDAEDALKKLGEEMLTAAVDHISDNRYYTHAPLKLEVKPDYFTEGVKLFVSFDKFDEERGERELNVTVPAAKVVHLIPKGFPENLDPDGQSSVTSNAPAQMHRGELVVRVSGGPAPVEKRFDLEQGRRLSIGRTKNNDIALDHTSVSKMHASLLLNAAGRLVVADTGSTNGTYLNGERIAYGKAVEMFEGDKLKFGAVDVELGFIPAPAPSPTIEPEISADAPTEAFAVGDFEFSKKSEVSDPPAKADPAETAKEASDAKPDVGE